MQPHCKRTSVAILFGAGRLEQERRQSSVRLERNISARKSILSRPPLSCSTQALPTYTGTNRPHIAAPEQMTAPAFAERCGNEWKPSEGTGQTRNLRYSTACPTVLDWEREPQPRAGLTEPCDSGKGKQMHDNFKRQAKPPVQTGGFAVFSYRAFTAANSLSSLPSLNGAILNSAGFGSPSIMRRYWIVKLPFSRISRMIFSFEKSCRNPD